MKKYLSFAGVALVGLSLTACSGGGGNAASQAPTSAPTATQSASSTPVATPTSESPTSAAATSSDLATPTTVESTTESSEAAASVAPVPAGAKLKAGSIKALPKTVLGFAKQGGSGPAVIYSKNGNMFSVSGPLSSPLDSFVAYIVKDKTKAGTGYCGETNVAESEVCYLAAEDGVISVSASSSEVPLKELVAAVEQLTAEVGVTK